VDGADGRDGGGGGGGGGSFYLEKPGKSEGMRLFSLMNHVETLVFFCLFSFLMVSFLPSSWETLFIWVADVETICLLKA
jgi:hypothetical protein